VRGLRGLFAASRQAGDIVTARSLADRALKLNPGLGWASAAMLAIQSAEGDWTAALATLESRRKAGQVGADEARAKRAILLTAQAIALEGADRERALKLALEAHGLDPGLVPAATVAGRIYSHQGAERKTWKVVSRTWAKLPHPDLASVYAYARPGSSPQDRLERVRRLVNSHQGGIEGSYALARAATAARQWSEARRLLDPIVLAGEPQARFCALLADVEEGEGDKGKAREWLARAVRAPRDPMWVVDGVAVARWTPLSPVSGEIVAAEWKVPFDLLPGEALPPAAPEEAKSEPQPERIAAPPPVAEPPAPPPQPQVPRPVMVKPARPPDDPGPQNGEPFASPRPALADG
jgi:HemY protein